MGVKEPETRKVIPHPVSLIESMRSVGYTLEAAVADIIDNSLSARSRNISVLYDASATPYISILDDGDGMTESELLDAMRHGSSSPVDPRGESDLGRFGLGLKTASLSQARKLTVVSRKEGITSAMQWDLDFVGRKKEWLVVLPAQEELERLPQFQRLLSNGKGTLVVWQELDRLVAGASDIQQEMTVKMEPLLEHLALVFHRFTQKEGDCAPVAITVNGLGLPHRDPFLSGSSFRQVLEGQTISSKHGNVTVAPFVLPPVSHMTPEEIATAGGGAGLRGTQGFYVYRGRRLVIWGTWFRLVPKHELYKLTRIRVDIPNSFDGLWALDIKKSAAHPPAAIRDRLKQLIPHFADKSKRTVVYAGRKESTSSTVPLWQKWEPKHGAFGYQVNVEHPLVGKFSEGLDNAGQKQLQTIFEYLGMSLPFQAIYADMCTDQPASGDAELDQLVSTAQTLLEYTGLSLDAVMKIDPLARYSTMHNAIREKLKDV